MKTIKQLEKEIWKKATKELDYDDSKRNFEYEEPIIKLSIEETKKAIKKMIEDRIDELEKIKQEYYNKKLKAFEEHSQFEGMYLGLAQETEKIINELKEILSKIEGENE